MGSGYDFALVKFSGSNPLAIHQKSAVALLALKNLHKGKLEECRWKIKKIKTK